MFLRGDLYLIIKIIKIIKLNLDKLALNVIYILFQTVAWAVFEFQ